MNVAIQAWEAGLPKLKVMGSCLDALDLASMVGVEDSSPSPSHIQPMG